MIVSICFLPEIISLWTLLPSKGFRDTELKGDLIWTKPIPMLWSVRRNPTLFFFHHLLDRSERKSSIMIIGWSTCTSNLIRTFIDLSTSPLPCFMKFSNEPTWNGSRAAPSFAPTHARRCHTWNSSSCNDRNGQSFALGFGKQSTDQPHQSLYFIIRECKLKESEVAETWGCTNLARKR